MPKDSLKLRMRDDGSLLTRGERREGKEIQLPFPSLNSLLCMRMLLLSFSSVFESNLPKMGQKMLPIQCRPEFLFRFHSFDAKHVYWNRLTLTVSFQSWWKTSVPCISTSERRKTGLTEITDDFVNGLNFGAVDVLQVFQSLFMVLFRESFNAVFCHY